MSSKKDAMDGRSPIPTIDREQLTSKLANVSIAASTSKSYRKPSTSFGAPNNSQRQQPGPDLDSSGHRPTQANRQGPHSWRCGERGQHQIKHSENNAQTIKRSTHSRPEKGPERKPEPTMQAVRLATSKCLTTPSLESTRLRGLAVGRSRPITDWNTSPPKSSSHATLASSSRTEKPRPVPQPSTTYIARARSAAQLAEQPQKLLLVLDLNGTLLARKRGAPWQAFIPRPRMRNFLAYCLAHHVVLIWSSARPESVQHMCSEIFAPTEKIDWSSSGNNAALALDRALLAGEWDRGSFGLSRVEYDNKVQVYKHLSQVWDSKEVQRRHPHHQVGARWDQTNTVLIDDTAMKASAEPFNHVGLPEFVRGMQESNNVLAQVVGWLEEARKWDNVSAFVASEARKGSFAVDSDWTYEWPTEPSPAPHQVVHQKSDPRPRLAQKKGLRNDGKLVKSANISHKKPLQPHARSNPMPHESRPLPTRTAPARRNEHPA